MLFGERSSLPNMVSHCDNKEGNRCISSAKGPWKALSSLQAAVDQYTIGTLGSGNTIIFWHDR